MTGCNFYHKLHRFFVSAKNDEERLMRIKDFIEGSIQFKSINDMEPYRNLIAVVDELFKLLEDVLEVRIHNLNASS